jgi:hypothetical protein
MPKMSGFSKSQDRSSAGREINKIERTWGDAETNVTKVAATTASTPLPLINLPLLGGPGGNRDECPRVALDQLGFRDRRSSRQPEIKAAREHDDGQQSNSALWR